MQDEDKPFDRDAWRRLLQPGAGEPPRATDERIRGEARRALAPHAGRWWLPASLAASLLLAVLLVQWQYEEIRAPALVSESDVAPAADESTRSTPVPARQPAVAAPAFEAPAPAADLPGMQKATAAPAPAADAGITAGIAQRDEMRTREAVAAEPVTPEEWYARIEALRAAGHAEEADAELKRLEETFPGWLEQHRGESR